jgi:hypothetical protein
MPPSRTRPLSIRCWLPDLSRFVSGVFAHRALFSDVDQLDEILDTEVGEREDAIVVKAVDPYDAVLDLHFKGDVVQQVYLLAEVSGDAVDCLDVGDLVDVHFQEAFSDVDVRLRADGIYETPGR